MSAVDFLSGQEEHNEALIELLGGDPKDIPQDLGESGAREIEPDAIWDGRLRNLVAMQTVYVSSVKGALGTQLAQVEEILELIEAEIVD